MRDGPEKIADVETERHAAALRRKVNEEFYEHKFTEYTDRLKTLEAKIAQHDKADINYYEFGLKVLELAKNAGKLYEMGTTEERHEIMRYLLSNSTLKDGKPIFALKQPFSEIAKRSLSGERSTWLGGLDSNQDKQLQRLLSYRWTTPEYFYCTRSDSSLWKGSPAHAPTVGRPTNTRSRSLTIQQR